MVPDEHQRRHRRLAQQRRKSQPTLAAYVPSEKCEGLLAEPQAAQTQVPRPKRQVTRRDARSRQAAYRSRECRPPHAPAERKNKEPVEHHIDESSKQAAPHGEFRSTVQTQGEHGDRRPQRKEHRRGEPDEIIHHHRQQTFGRAEPIGRPLRKKHDGADQGQSDGRHEKQRLGDIHTRHAGPAPRKAKRCGYRTAHSHHQAEARQHHQQRHTDIDRRDSIAPHAVSDKDAVYRRHCRHAQHAEQGGKKYLPEQDRNLLGTPFNRLLFHTATFRLARRPPHRPNEKCRISRLVLPSHLIRHLRPPMRITKRPVFVMSPQRWVK